MLLWKHKLKTHSLLHHLQHSSGPTQDVIRAIMRMTFEEFLNCGRMYDGDIEHELEKFHKFVTSPSGIWPANVYIPLADLFDYLIDKGVRLPSLSLKYIPPIFLHWYDLVQVTNFDKIVEFDYYGERREPLSTLSNWHRLREEFYKRCWTHGTWVWRPPDVTDRRLLRHMQKSLGLSKAHVEAVRASELDLDGMIEYSRVLWRKHTTQD